MAKVCDRAPCDLLRRALDQLDQDHSGGRSYESDNYIEFVIPNHSPNKAPFRVTLLYCPFCGTRLTPKWVRAVKEKGIDD